MNGKNEPLNTTVSVKLEPETFVRFMRFVFRTEISKSDALRMGIEILMGAEDFIASKGKRISASPSISKQQSN